MQKRKYHMQRWSLAVIYCILLAVLIGNPEATFSTWNKIKEIINSMDNPSNTISWLGAISAVTSAIATFLSFRVASSSRDIAHHALSFQYQDTIKGLCCL